MTSSTDKLVSCFKRFKFYSILFLTQFIARSVGMDVKSDLTYNETIISDS